MSLAKAIATATTKALMASLPKAVAAKFEDVDEDEFATFLSEFLAEQLKGSGGRAPAAKGKNGKGRVTGYLLFSNEHRAQVKEDNPDIAFGDVGKELGKMWGKLTDKKKEVWNGKAKKQNEENGLLTGEAAKEAAKSKAAASKSKPAAKGKGKAAAKSKPAPTAPTMKVTRDKDALAWVIAGTKFAVQSPKNKVVVGKVSGKKVVALSAADKKKCAANGWELKAAPAKSKGKAAAKKVEEEQDDAEDEDEGEEQDEDEGTEDDEGEEQDDAEDEDDEDDDE